jgi:Flp pilus assembly pilin Flp
MEAIQYKLIFFWRKNMSKSVEQTKAIVQSMITLASAALGLVAALAWNEAIKAAMKELLGGDESLAALFTYAILATLVAVVVLVVLSRVAAKVGGEAAISREAEG